VILVALWDLGPAAREALGAAARLGDEIAVALLGDPASAEKAGAYGATQAFVFDGDLAGSGGEAAITGLTELARELDARAVLLPRDDRTAEIAPRLAERLGGTAVTQTVAVELTDGRLVWTRSAYGGKALVAVTAAAEPVVATLTRGAFAPAEATGGTATVSTRSAPAVDGAVELLEREAPSTGASLEDAKVIVSGGAGLGAADAFRELEELAGLLGGAVGASLAAVDAGWAPADRQVGLTGKVVSPDVYFAIGISGASQHLAGIGGAKAVVAVNTDADAPIFASARLGVVMDCHTFVRSMIEQLRSAT
jgi:electron transfer flavoprotein alpha subunit